MNRRFFIRSLPALAALAALPALSFGRDERGREGVVTISALNVRSGPSASDPPVGVVNRGERVRIHNYVNGWYEISTRRLSGWASGSYIEPVDDYGRDRPRHDDRRDYDRPRHDDRRRYDEPEYAEPSSRDRFAVIGRNRRGYVNMFDGPGRDYQVVGRLSEGERVRVIEAGRHWTLVGKRGVGRGYVRSELLDSYR
jgi:uncharacterized protein YraI